MKISAKTLVFMSIQWALFMSMAVAVAFASSAEGASESSNAHPGAIPAGSEGHYARDDVRPSSPSNLMITDPDGEEVFECQEQLEPLAHFGRQIVIGQGNPEGCSEMALKEAVGQLENTQSGGTILFDCGAARHTIVITSEIEMNNGKILIDGHHRIALSGEDKSRVFHTTGKQNHLMLQRISILRGTAVESGAGIYSEWRGALTAVDVTFMDNHCTGMIGEKGGGAIRLRGPGDTIISGCTFIGNTAANGGAIMTTAGNVNIVNSVFKNNQALAQRPIGNNDNLAYGNGGAVRLDGMNKENRDDFRVCGTVFTDNVANGSGGSINAFFYKIDNTYVSTFIDQCVFRNNTGDAVAAYIHMNGEMHMSRTSFVGNSADGTGALFLATDSNSRIENCTFADNTADTWGAVRVRDGVTDFVNCTFAANTATYAPLFDDGDAAHVRLKNCIIADNQSNLSKNARACRASVMDGGGNLQWPEDKPNGSNDVPCTSRVTWENPNMQAMAEASTGMPYLPIGDGSPAINLGTDCPEHDQLGKDRSNPCDAGSFEY